MTAAAADVLPPHRALLGVAGPCSGSPDAAFRLEPQPIGRSPADNAHPRPASITVGFGTTRMPPAAGPTLRTAAHTVRVQ